MAFRVETTVKAERELSAIQDWLLSEQAGDAGLAWFLRLRDALDSLSEMPYRCPLAREKKGLSSGIRQLLYGNKPHVYRILFTIENDTVTVLGVRHGRRAQ